MHLLSKLKEVLQPQKNLKPKVLEGLPGEVQGKHKAALTNSYLGL